MTIACRATDDATSRTSAYEALGTLVKFAPEDALPVASKVLVVILERSERLLAMQGQLLGDDDRRNYADLQVAFCAVLTVSRGLCTPVRLLTRLPQHTIRRLGKQVSEVADRTMTLLLRLLQGAGQKSPILDDAFLAVGAMTYGAHFCSAVSNGE